MNKQEQLIFFKLLTFQPGTSFMMTTSSSKFSLSIRKVLAQRQHSAQHLNSWPVFASLGSIKDGHSSCVWKGQWPSICILSNGQQRATPVLEKKTQSIPKFLWDPSKHFPDVFRDSVCSLCLYWTNHWGHFVNESQSGSQEGETPQFEAS